MKLKLFSIVCVLMLLLTMACALAESVGKYGITDLNQNWLQSTKGTHPYTINWSDFGQSDNMPLVYDINNDGSNEVIQNRNGIIRVYDLDGNVLASRSIANLNNRQLTAFDAQRCPSGRGIYALYDDQMAVICLVNSSLITYGLSNPGSNVTIPDGTGASVSKDGSDNLAVYYYFSNNTNQSAVAFYNETSSTTATYGLGTVYAFTSVGVPPHGNLLNDGYEYWVFYYWDGASYGVSYINKLGNVTTFLAGSSYNLTTIAPIVIKRGGGHVDDLLIPHNVPIGTCYYVNYYADRFWYGDATGLMYVDFTPIDSEFPFCQDTLYSNPVQLGTNGDICWSYTSLGGNKFLCKTPSTLSTSYNSTVPSANYDLLAMDMNNDGFADFFFGTFTGANLCLYTGHANNLTCMDMGFVANYVYGVDADSDGYRDIIASDSTNNLIRLFRTGGALSNLTFCADTDLASYPSINYTLRGTMSATGITNRTDYCVGNYAMEYYCDNSSSYHAVPVSHDCSADGKACVNGACTTVPANGTCDDSDSLTYPTLNYYMQGTATSNNGTVISNTDYCNGNALLEYYCSDPNVPIMSNLSYDCFVNDGMTCSNGRCVYVPSGCPSGVDTFSAPTLWLETFPYANSITSHGWSGYAFIPGVNIYNTCNKLFMAYNTSAAEVQHSFGSTLTGNTTFQWDMLPESSTSSTTYIPNGLPVDVRLYNAAGSQAIWLEFASDGLIYNHDGVTNPAIGNWQSGLFSFKMVMDADTHQFDFYFTNTTNALSFTLGCANCSFRNNLTITKVGFEPQSPFPANYTSVGIWLDNLKLSQGGSIVPIDNTNFCYFTGCIFHDHFNYSDDTYTHGWYMFNTTPVSSVVTYGNSNNGYYFDHSINTIHSSDNNGLSSAQFRVLFPQPPTGALDLIHFALYASPTVKPIDIEFSDGIIFDVNQGVKSLGTYAYNQWYTFSLELNLASNTYDLYMDGNKIASGETVAQISSEIGKVGFWVNTNSTILIDYVTVAQGTLLTDSLRSGGVGDTGVALSDLRNCWYANGTFDWSCCTASQNSTKSMWCPISATGRFFLGNVTNFVLGNFIYFLILLIIFVVATPYIIPAIRRQ